MQQIHQVQEPRGLDFEMVILALDVLSKCESLQVLSKSFNRPYNHSTNVFILFFFFALFINTLFQLSNIRLKEENDPGK